ncbi:MAG TPA: phosphoribosylaminoimidazolesuccinocarboxamide synthase [Spirochaetales bacterium]|nr:phosphoribosylaminoimidazolesuccinocarboxamide synthase [Spirochaetales bacterium]HQG40286.1 phosphoribosylaminoimidazolesuccinocarboxamide synthase [Spirochaetales bacterium]HQK33671.1 phosphoribosylaminoimidazolesuccinocarboxamide synthase [Spirochaetales bacterium]
MTSTNIAQALSKTFHELSEQTVPHGCKLYRGKVRDVITRDDTIALVASDRISAFDRVLSTVPYKGEILTRIAYWWFKHTEDIIKNHLVSPDELGGHDAVLETGRCMIGRRCSMLPVEVVVRGYLTGSAWRDYQEGKPVSGIKLPGGLRYCQQFPEPILTPSTKAESGHDKPISCEEIVTSGLVDKDVWAEVERKALAVFKRGQALAQERGLILVDTKYEFGILNGELVLADEIHTPDSSRYWYSESYEELFKNGSHQKELDKETFRRWLMSNGFSGDGEPPVITDEIRIATAQQYITAFETITGEQFAPILEDPHAIHDACTLIIAEAFNENKHPAKQSKGERTG